MADDESDGLDVDDRGVWPLDGPNIACSLGQMLLLSADTRSGEIHLECYRMRVILSVEQEVL